MTAKLLKLDNRATLRLSGPDTLTFLQGILTNEVAGLTKGQAVYAALLTPQGKFLFDMIVVSDGKDILLDVEEKRRSALMQRLMMYKLRADVTITEDSAAVWALWDGKAETGLAYTDPRHADLQTRVIAETAPIKGAGDLPYTEYEEKRIRCGVPDGSRDMTIEKHFWLETRAEALNGVSFNKGCYVGQELTARMKHRTALKKKLIPVELTGDANSGEEIETESGKLAGELHSVVDGYALAFMRLEYLNHILFVKDSDTQVRISATEQESKQEEE